jgi:hypothetical protein
MCYLYLFNLYKYIYYNFCVYKKDDIDDDEKDTYNNVNLNKLLNNNYNNRVILNLDEIIINSMVYNNIEIPFYEIKSYNYHNYIGFPKLFDNKPTEDSLLHLDDNIYKNDEYIMVDNKDCIKID